MVVAALHPVHRLLELRTLSCWPVKSQLCGSEDPAQPLPQSQGGLSPALPAYKKSPRGWAATRMRGLWHIPALLTTPACPRDWPSVCSQAQHICPGLAFSPPVPGSWGAADLNSGRIKMRPRRLGLSSSLYLLRFP